MSGLFGGGKSAPPPPPPPPPPPAAVPASAVAAEMDAKAKDPNKVNRKKTQVTGPQGVLDDSDDNVSRPGGSLLGSAAKTPSRQGASGLRGSERGRGGMR